MSRIIEYVDPNQNVFYFEDEEPGSREPHNNYYGTIIRIRRGWAPNVHNWAVGDKISVVKCVCRINEHMKYSVETNFGCTAASIIINGKEYNGETSKNSMTPYEKEQFRDALLHEIYRSFLSEELGVYNLLQLLQPESEEFSANCKTCGDYVTTSKYNF